VGGWERETKRSKLRPRLQVFASGSLSVLRMSPPTGQLLTNQSHVKTSPKWSFPGKHDAEPVKATPGPGAYRSDQDAAQNRTPAYGFGNSNRERQRPQSAPGPGSYAAQERNKQTSPSWNFGTSNRDRGGVVGTPGPGAYAAAPDFHEGPKATMTPRRDGLGPNMVNPGPGSYNHAVHVDSQGPKYGFGKSGRAGGERSAGPGPGAYMGNHDALHQSPPMHTMTPRRNSRGRATTPGPGSYRTCSAPHSGTQPKWGFGTSSRNGGGGYAGENPGPGSYATDKANGAEGPKFTMQPRRASNSRPTTPGPGAYRSDATPESAPKWGFGSGGRTPPPAGGTPGPGSYQRSGMGGATHDGRGGCTMTPRRETGSRPTTPGPGAYQQRMADAGDPSFSFGSSQRGNQMPSNAPGPGSYNTSQHMGSQGPSHRMGGRPCEKAQGDGDIGGQYTQFGY